jgi:acetyl-CoA carboxylase carboxyl transferase subunit alpha
MTTKLPAWEIVKIARHPARPHTLDYINALFTNFLELKGDRSFADDPALVGGMADFQGRTVVVIGHQKGANTRENLERNFGMARPEGYRKARRLFNLAAKFELPVICFIDTPGAYPGPESEERGMAQAIAENLVALAELPVPVLSVVIGEGGSGGALAIGLSNRILMLENSIYSVASPEAAASILWHDAAQAAEAALALRLTAEDLQLLEIVDEVIDEPPDGAHTDPSTTFKLVGQCLLKHLSDLEQHFVFQVGGASDLVEQRQQKFRAIHP